MKVANINKNTDQSILSLHHNSDSTFSYFNNKKIVIPLENEFKVIKFDKILYVQADGNYSTLFLSHGNSITASKTLKWIAEKVNHEFLRVHQSFLINLNFIDSYDKKSSTLLMENNTSIPVSRSSKKQLQLILSK